MRTCMVVFTVILSPIIQANAGHSIATPAAGTTLTPVLQDGCFEAATTTFHWEVDPETEAAIQWWFTVSREANSADGPAAASIFSSGLLPPHVRSTEIRNLPTDGAPIFATLWWLNPDGVWKFDTSEYPTAVLPSVSSGNNERPLGAAGEFFLERNGLPVQYWWIYAGREPQRFDYLTIGFEADTEAELPLRVPYQEFPTNGTPIHITLFWRLAGEGPEKWKCREFVYGNEAGPPIDNPDPNVPGPSPKPGDHLPPSSTPGVITPTPEVPINPSAFSGTIEWRLGLDQDEVSEWSIDLSSAPSEHENGAPLADLGSSGLLPSHTRSHTFDVNLEGISRLYVTLGWKSANDPMPDLEFATFEYVVDPDAAEVPHEMAPRITGPIAGSTLGPIPDMGRIGCFGPANVTFTWEARNQTKGWWIHVSTAEGEPLASSGVLAPDARSYQVDNFPTIGGRVYVKLWWLNAASQWQFVEAQYEAATLPSVSSSSPGSKLASSSGEFTPKSNGLPVKYWWIYAGATPQSTDYLSTGSEEPAPHNPTNTPIVYTGFPTDGSPVYVTLFWRFEGEGPSLWKCREFVYEAASPPDSPAEPTLVALPVFPPVLNSDVANYILQISYQSETPIDITTLGNNDVSVSPRLDGDLFDGIQSEPHFAELDRFETMNEGREVIATYRFPRPKAGWEALGDSPIISTTAGSVTDILGGQLPGEDIGTIPIRISPAPILMASLQGFPQLPTPQSSVAQVQVSYHANYANELQFDGSELQVTVQLAADQAFEGEHAYASVAVRRIVRVPNDSQWTVTYQITAPTAGWGSEDRATIAYSPSRLGRPGQLDWIGLGTLSLRPSPAITATVLSSPVENEVARHAFQILLESRATPLDESRLNRTEARIGHPWTSVVDGLTSHTLADWLGSDTFDDGFRARVYLEIDRPSEGWSRLGTYSMDVRLVDTERNSRKEPGLGLIGRIPMVFQAVVAPHQKAFDDWIKEMEKSLGLEPGTVKDRRSDLDNDGLSDLSEYGLGSDPRTGLEPHPVNTGLEIRENGRKHATLGFTRRINAVSVHMSIEASTDGLHWKAADDQFESVSLQYVADNLEKLMFRSIEPIGPSESKLFRVATHVLR